MESEYKINLNLKGQTNINFLRKKIFFSANYIDAEFNNIRKKQSILTKLLLLKHNYFWIYFKPTEMANDFHGDH